MSDCPHGHINCTACYERERLDRAQKRADEAERERDEAREVAVLLVESLRFCAGQGPRPDPERAAGMAERMLTWPK